MCQGMCMEVTRQPVGVSSLFHQVKSQDHQTQQKVSSSLLTELSHQPKENLSGERTLKQKLKLNEGDSKLCSYAKGRVKQGY